MLDREEDAALAEIEAALRRDDPDFVDLLERLERDPLGVADGPERLDHADRVDILDAPALVDAPALAELQAMAAQPFELVEEHSPRHTLLLVVSVVAAVLLALAVTLAVTAAWGPDAGGLAGVVSIMAATMYGYQALRGCPGRHR